MRFALRMARANIPRRARIRSLLLISFIVSAAMFANYVVAAAAPSEKFRVSNSQRPLSPNCHFVDTTVPYSVLSHQLVNIPTLGTAANSRKLTIHGRLCLPATGTPKTVMLALHGVTYNNQYWDVGYQPNTYSFVRKMTNAGYAVYAVDRLGYGGSSHPPGALVTMDAEAAVIHHLVTQLRQGDIGNHRYARIILVGHSAGTMNAWLESAEYNDADAVIGTGWGSSIQTGAITRFAGDFLRYPALLDKKTRPFVGADPSYFTTPPNGRAQNYLYDLSNVDPNMIKYDQHVLRDTVTLGEGATFYNRYSKIPLGYIPTTSDELSIPLPSVTKKIHIPMFLDDGEHDLFFCGPDSKYCNSNQTLQKEESHYFSPKACLRTAVTPHAGHDLNLQRNAPLTYNTMRRWADQVLGPDGNNYQHYTTTCQSSSGTNNTSNQLRPAPTS